MNLYNIVTIYDNKNLKFMQHRCQNRWNKKHLNTILDFEVKYITLSSLGIIIILLLFFFSLFMFSHFPVNETSMIDHTIGVNSWLHCLGLCSSQRTLEPTSMIYQRWYFCPMSSPELYNLATSQANTIVLELRGETSEQI